MKTKTIIPIKNLSAEVDSLYKVMNEESDLACALIGASFLDQCLGSILKNRLRKNSETVKSILKPDKGFLGSFSNRIDLCYSLEVIEKRKFNDLKVIVEIRNTFAHSHLNITFESTEIIDLCDKLNSYKVAFPSEYFSEETENNKNAEFIAARNKYNTSVAIISQEILVKELGKELFG